MIFLINASNLKAGGGLQVADSICCQLNKFKDYHFVVILSIFLEQTKERIKDYKNVEVFQYNVPDTFRSVVLGRDSFLDNIVIKKKVNAVLTVFGPSRWIPRVAHLSGFALPQLVLPESPFFERMGYVQRLKWEWWGKIRKWSLKRSADVFWTENPLITQRLIELFKTKTVYTVSNYYNQIFDHPEQWRSDINLNENLNEKGSVTMLTVSSTASHKNLGIMVPVAEYLESVHPEFNFRFVLTCNKAPFELPEKLSKHFVFVGKVDVSECPNLYEQADIMFMPTLMECFTATYPEAMRMGVPIVTTDLEFARGLCGEAASYYSALDAIAAAEAIYKVVTDETYKKSLIDNGKKQLLTYDNYEQRAEKLIRVLEEIAQAGLGFTI